MNKKERIQAIRNGEVPDCMPVFPFILTHGVYACGWRLPDITGPGFLDGEKSAQTVLETLKKYDYDIAFGSYFDLYFGLEVLGGTLKVTDQYGGVVGAEKWPVEDPLDWPEVKKKFTTIFEKDQRIKGVLDSIKIVAKEVGDEVPIAVWGMPGATNCTCLLRNTEALTKDMIRDPKFAYELCDYSNKFNIEFIRRQYDAGANSVTILGDVFGTELTSPKMYEKFGLPFIQEIVDVVKKEFNQEVWLHVHGDFRGPKANALLDILVNEIGVKALHLDQDHDAAWVKENVADKYKIPAAVMYHGPHMFTGPEDKIDKDVYDIVSNCSPNYSYMAPTCEVPPDVPMSYIDTWVRKTHEYSAKIYSEKK